MYEMWCDTCEREMKCHNHDGFLYCIGCKEQIGVADVRTVLA